MDNMFNMFKSNPAMFLAKKGINIPQNIVNDPKAMVQYLMNSGRMSQQQFEQLKAQANQKGYDL